MRGEERVNRRIRLKGVNRQLRQQRRKQAEAAAACAHVNHDWGSETSEEVVDPLNQVVVVRDGWVEHRMPLPRPAAKQRFGQDVNGRRAVKEITVHSPPSATTTT